MNSWVQPQNKSLGNGLIACQGTLFPFAGCGPGEMVMGLHQDCIPVQGDAWHSGTCCETGCKTVSKLSPGRLFWLTKHLFLLHSGAARAGTVLLCAARRAGVFFRKGREGVERHISVTPQHGGFQPEI